MKSKRHPKAFIVLIVVLIASIGFNAILFHKYSGAKSDLEYYVSYTPNHYKILNSDFRRLDRSEHGDIVFLGDSITNYGHWDEYFKPSAEIVNRGIPGDTTAGVLKRLGDEIEGKPSKMFIMIGINDLLGGVSIKALYQNYDKMLKSIQLGSPSTKVYVESVLPINHSIYKTSVTNKKISDVNKRIKSIASKYSDTYINIGSLVQDKNGELNKNLTIDGLHVNGDGYKIWSDAIAQYVN